MPRKRIFYDYDDYVIQGVEDIILSGKIKLDADDSEFANPDEYIDYLSNQILDLVLVKRKPELICSSTNEEAKQHFMKAISMDAPSCLGDVLDSRRINIDQLSSAVNDNRWLDLEKAICCYFVWNAVVANLNTFCAEDDPTVDGIPFFDVFEGGY